MLGRIDIERIIGNEIIQNLKIEVRRGDFTDPNSRIISLMYKDMEISQAHFDVVAKEEYEG